MFVSVWDVDSPAAVPANVSSFRPTSLDPIIERDRSQRISDFVSTSVRSDRLLVIREGLLSLLNLRGNGLTYHFTLTATVLSYCEKEQVGQTDKQRTSDLSNMMTAALTEI